MKIFIALCAFFAIASASESEFVVKKQEDLQKFRIECVKELNITAEEIEQFKKWNFTESGSAPCYLKCVFQKMELFDDEKGFLVDNLVAQMTQESNKDTIKSEVEKCAKQENDNKCLQLFHGFECFRKNNLELIKTSLKTKDGKPEEKKEEQKEEKKE